MKQHMLLGRIGLALTFSVLGLAMPGLAQHGGTGHPPQGYLGIDVRDVNDDEVAGLKLKDTHGAEVIRVDHDGPAGKMALRDRDVILQLNGTVIDGEDQIRRLLREIPPGRTVTMLISRDGLALTVTAQMADRTEVERQAWERHLTPPLPQSAATSFPMDDTATQASAAAPAAPAPNAKYSKGFLGTLLMTPAYTGLLLERMGAQLASFFGAPKGTGLLVKNVDTNSPAAVAGIKAGDVVVRADSKPVVNITDFARAVREAKGRPVSVVVLRDRQEHTLFLTPDARKHS